MTRYVVIGNSIAGLSGVRAIRSRDTDGEITVVSLEKHNPYSKVLLTHYIAGHVSKEGLYLASQDELNNLNANFLMGAKAVDLDGRGKEVILDDGRSLSYDYLLVATGSRPKMPDSIPAGINGITGLRTVEDADLIKKHASNGGKVIILGGGLVGVKLACALRERGVFPEIIIGSPHIMSKVADDEGALIIEEHMRAEGVTIRTGTDIAGIDYGPEGIESLSFTDGQTIKCDALAVCKGVSPNTEFLGRALPGKRGVKVNQNMMTDLQDVYAAGDVAVTYEVTAGVHNTAAIWPHAVEQGRIAGLNMAGKKCSYRGSLSRNALEIIGLPFISIGITNPKGCGDDWDFDIINGKKEYKKLVYRNGKLVGAVLLGRVEEAGRLQAIIRHNTNILV